MKFFNKIFHKNRFLTLSDKRQRFTLQTVILTAGLMITQLIWDDYRFFMVLVLSVLSYLLTAWSLREDIKGWEWILLFIMPVFFTAATSLFYFLLPARWISRLFLIIIFAVGIYATLLIENIYNVAAIRSIQLVRAAQSVGLLITLVVIFLSANTIISLRLIYWKNLLIFIPLTFILALQSLWSVALEEKLSSKLLIYAAVVALGIGELVLVLSFWPIQLASASLFITATFYSLTGVIQQNFLERLFKNTVKEYIISFIFTFLLVLLTTNWG